MALIIDNLEFTLEEIGKYVGLTVRGVRYNTDNLKRKGQIKRVGFGKKGY